MSNVNCSFIIEDFESIDPNRHNPLSNFSQRPLAEVQEIWWQTELESSRKKKKNTTTDDNNNNKIPKD